MICQTMWYDQSDEIIVYEHNMPSHLVRSIRPSSLLASPHTIWKRLALQLMVGRISAAVTMSDIPFVCQPSTHIRSKIQCEKITNEIAM